MNEERFVHARVTSWEELRDLVNLAHGSGLRSLGGDRVRRLGALYRQATADLATARTHGLTSETQAHLNRLCASSHDLIYAGRTAGGVGRALTFLRRGFPSLVRRTAPYHLVAAGLFLVAATAAFFVFRDDPELADATLGPGMRSRAHAAIARADAANRYVDIPGLLRPFASWGLMAHNMNVALMAFALGSVGAIGGVGVLLLNGVSIGGALGIFADEGVAEVLLTFVAAHGPLELTGVFIATGAGVRVGLAPLMPGRLSRWAALVSRGRESVALLGGVAVLLVIAGLLEGFVSPSDLPPPAKWCVGLATAIALGWYLLRAGRSSTSDASA